MTRISALVTGGSSLSYYCNDAAATCPNNGGAGVQVCANGFMEANDVCNSFPGNMPAVINGIGYGAYYSGMGLNVESTCGCSYSVFYP